MTRYWPPESDKLTAGFRTKETPAISQLSRDLLGTGGDVRRRTQASLGPRHRARPRGAGGDLPVRNLDRSHPAEPRHGPDLFDPGDLRARIGRAHDPDVEELVDRREAG